MSKFVLPKTSARVITKLSYACFVEKNYLLIYKFKIMKRLNLKSLSRSEMKNLYGGKSSLAFAALEDLQGWKCCNSAGCGTCTKSSGMPTCPSTSTLTAC
jgi:hypothetical protein